MTTLTMANPTTVDLDLGLCGQLSDALEHPTDSRLQRLNDRAPAGRRDRFATLLHIYELWSAPVEDLGAAARFLGHPSIAAIKQRCEADWLTELEARELPAGLPADDVVAALRALAARDRLPGIYRWLSRDASWDEVVTFLALEGGPDAGFDDLVAACQIGLRGRAKLELATNYWDEMGNGELRAVHTTLHEQLTTAISLPKIALSAQPTSALERAALGGLLATNRWLQPESLGALGLTELQAGPRCQLVLKAFDRHGAPPEARRFYEVHAEVDPRHGRDWLDNAVAPTVTQIPSWSARVVRGAHWRSMVNSAFFDDVERLLLL